MSSLHEDFQETGQSADAEATFRWLDRVDGNPLIQEIKQQMLDVCAVGAGDQVLDVGCGLGHEVRRLAERVGSHGRVVGIDATPFTKPVITTEPWKSDPAVASIKAAAGLS